MFHNILVSVDGSSASERALSEAIELARHSGARLTILTAIQPPPPWVCSPASAAALPLLKAELEREAEKIQRCAIDRVPGDIPVTSILSRAPIRKALGRELASGRHDLLVIGSGRGPRLRHSPVPVLLVHDEQELAPTSDVTEQPPVRTGPAPSGPLPATG